MKRILALAAVAAVAIAAAAPAVADDDDHGRGPAGGAAGGATATYLVEFNAGTDNDREAEDARGGGAKVRHQYRSAFNGMAVELNASQLAKLQADPNVKRIEPDGVVTAYDTQGGATWGIDRTDQRNRPLDGTYTYSTTASNVTAYIIDTGILPGHTEFGGRVKAGFDAVTSGGTAVDCNGHGTHVAGTVGGATYGLAKSVDLVPVRVLDCLGSGSWTGVAAGIDWVVANHPAGQAAVANLSLGGGASTIVDDAINRLVADGVTVAVAAGNSNLNACNYSPARVPAAITVGATDSTDTRASYSNFGSCLDIFAPGSAITSSWYTSTTATNTISGTSMASPHVAGAAALYLAANPGATPADVATALTGNATPSLVTNAGTGSPNRLLYVGTGNVTPPPVPEIPTVTLLSPATGPVGTAVTITGTNLTGATAVTFNGTAATFTVASATSITTTVPSGATSGVVQVTTPGGTANGPSFTVTVPTVTVPAAPTIGTATASTTRTGRATLTWTRSANNGGAAITSQRIKAYRLDTGTATTYVVSSTSSSATLTGLSSTRQYRFTVAAVNSAGTSPESALSNTVTIR